MVSYLEEQLEEIYVAICLFQKEKRTIIKINE